MSFREQAELIDQLFARRFAERDRRWDGKFGALSGRVDGLESRIGRLETRVDRLETRMSRLEEKLDLMGTDVAAIKDAVTLILSKLP